MKLLPIVFLLLTFAYSCKQDASEKKVKVKTINIPLHEKTKDVTVDFFSIDTVKLETNGQSLFGKVTQLVSGKDGFYILDDFYTKSILKFNKNGKFLYKLDKHGKGPGEFIRPRWMSLDESKGELYVYDPILAKVLIFNLENGAYVKSSRRLEFNARSFELTPDKEGFVFYTGFMKNKSIETKENSFQVIITDKKFNVEKLYFPFNKEHVITNFIGVGEVYSVNKNNLFMFSQFRDTIYSIQKDYNIIPVYKLNYGYDNQKLADKYVESMLESRVSNFSIINKNRDASGVFSLYRQYQTKDHIYLTGVGNGNSYFFIYDKVKNKTINLENADVPLIFFGSDDEYFYTLLDKNTYFQNLNPKLKKIYNKINENDNSILLKLKVNK